MLADTAIARWRPAFDDADQVAAVSLERPAVAAQVFDAFDQEGPGARPGCGEPVQQPGLGAYYQVRTTLLPGHAHQAGTIDQFTHRVVDTLGLGKPRKHRNATHATEQRRAVRLDLQLNVRWRAPTVAAGTGVVVA